MSTKTAALITSRDKKGIAIIGLVEAALNKAKLDEDEAQRVFERGGEFQADVQVLLSKYATPQEFASEEVRSNYTYPDGYKVRPIAEQVAMLRQAFPQLATATFDETVALQPLPAGAEGWFAIPRPSALGATYNDAVLVVIDAVAKMRKLHNYREGQLGANQLRRLARTIAMWEKVGEAQQGHDILIVPAQFGLLHRGQSVRRAREVFKANEFGIGAYEALIMLRTHPERLVQWEQLHIDCPGDEYAGGGKTFGDASYVRFNDGGVGFGAGGVGDANEVDGSSSAFLPQ